MFTAKKILSSLILPPGIFVVLSLLLGFWLLRRRSKYGFLNLILAVMIYLLSIPPVANCLTSPLEKNWQISRSISGDVLVVLGGGIFSGVTDTSGRGFPAGTTLSRLITAVRLHRTTGLPIIFSGGKVFTGEDAEASVAQRILLELGVAADRIIIEDQSRDTVDNARFVKELCLRGNWRNPILITSASHMERAMRAFRTAGMQVTPYPADFRAPPEPAYAWPDFLPSTLSLAKSTSALHEYLGLLFYRIFY